MNPREPGPWKSAFSPHNLALGAVQWLVGLALAGLAGLVLLLLPNVRIGHVILFELVLIALIAAWIVHARSKRLADRRRAQIRVGIKTPLPFFTGRATDLQRLEAGVASEGRAVVSQILSGLGGVGKSQLVARFVQKHLDEYEIAAWIRCEVSPITDLSTLAVDLGLGDGELAPEELAKRAINFLENTNRRWLLVFDNVESATTLRPWFPGRGEGVSLVTTRLRGLEEFGPEFGVDVFDEQTGADYLLKRTGRDAERSDALRLTRALGGLPLALSHAAAYCRRGGPATFAVYLKQLGELPAEERFRTAPDAAYEQTVATTWRPSVEAAANEAGMALGILRMAAYLAAEGIPLELFGTLLPANPSPAESAALTDGFNALHDYSLAEVTDGELSVHRLLQKVVRDSASDDAGALNALRSVASAFPASQEELALPAGWGRCQQLTPHVFALQRSEKHLAEVGEALVNLCHSTCSYFLYAGDFKQAIDIGLHASETGERILGPDHPDTITARANLASSYWSAGRTTKAIPIEEQVVADRERILGPDHPDTIRARNNLAGSYQSAGRTAEAIPIEEQVVADRERILGPDHPDTIRARNNLAGYYQSAGRTAEAIPIQQQLVADCERILGPDHPDTITARNNLAGSYQSAGRTAEAIPIQQQVVTDSERILGPDHPDTITARNNLAGSYQSAGRTAEAIPIQQQVVADSERILGPDHPTTIKARNNLALSYHSAGRTAEAIPIQEQVVADYEKILGPDHPDTVSARNNLEVMRRSF